VCRENRSGPANLCFELAVVKASLNSTVGKMW